jgi:hypothetical protein
MTIFLNQTSQTLKGTLFGGALGDFNNDGYIDIAYSILNSKGPAIFLGRNGGGFNSNSLSFVNTTDIRSLGSADLNRDGLVDLIGPDLTSGNIYYFKGLGNGDFLAPTSLGNVSNAYMMVLADLDKNGTTDIAVTTQSSSSVAIFYTNTSGNVVSTKSVSSGGAWDRGIDAADFNNDGYQDLVVTNVNNNVASVLYGPNFTTQTLLTTGIYPIGVVAADLNNDGRTDFVTTNHNANSNSLSVFINTVTGFSRTDISLGGYPDDRITAKDFNGDGYLDLAVIMVGSGIKILLGNGTGTSYTTEFYSAANIGPAQPLFFDQNKDGDLDIITSMVDGIYIFENNATPPTYKLTSSNTSFNEGSTATFTLSTTNVAAGTSVLYTLSGVSAADVTGGALSGNAVVDSSGSATISVALVNDSLTEGSETLTVTAGGATASTVVNDTSKAAATYALTPGSSSVNEGSTATFTLSTTNVAAGTSVLYTLSGVSAADVTGGALSGNAVVDSSGSATISVALINDSLTEGSETLTVTAGGATAISSSVLISDTSKTPVVEGLVTSIPYGDGKYFYGSSSPDNVTGTSFVDVVKQPSTFASNQLTKLSDGSWQVQNKITPSNSDNLVNVERLEFSDMNVALDVSGPAGQVAKILGSVFGPSYVNNKAFVGIGLAYLDAGMSYLDLCGLAASFAGLTTPDLLVTTLLRNTTGTEPTALNKSSYLQSITNGTSYASIVQQIADSSANSQSIKLPDLGNTGLAYTPHVFLPTYSLSAASSSVNEGSSAVFNLTTTKVAVGTEVSYTLSGVSASDLTAGSLTGKVTIGAGGKASISIPVAMDSVTEGPETLAIKVQDATASIVLNDTSKSAALPTYILTTDSNNVNEGELARIHVRTIDVASETILEFGISGINITNSDVLGGLKGVVKVDSLGQAFINLLVNTDETTEGLETMYITIGTAIAQITINDTSVSLVGVIDGGGGY